MKNLLCEYSVCD